MNMIVRLVSNIGHMLASDVATVPVCDAGGVGLIHERNEREERREKLRCTEACETDILSFPSSRHPVTSETVSRS